MVPERSYLICATPRSGTGLLAGLLASTGVAGCPYEHFWPVDDGPLGEVVRDATAHNGVFGATVMWGYFEHGALGLNVAGLLPDLRFIRLRREDTIAQAVSHLRAIQTNVWHAGDVRRPGGAPRFDAAALDHLVAELELHNHAWDAWLDGQGATPLQLTYETLLA